MPPVCRRPGIVITSYSIHYTKLYEPAHIRFLGVFLQFFSIFAAISGLIAALYLAEDWLLLSGAIVLMLGMVWGVRQTLPKMWQQARLMLNMGSIREGERLTYQNVPWKVMTINVFVITSYSIHYTKLYDFAAPQTPMR